MLFILGVLLLVAGRMVMEFDPMFGGQLDSFYPGILLIILGGTIIILYLGTAWRSRNAPAQAHAKQEDDNEDDEEDLDEKTLKMISRSWVVVKTYGSIIPNDTDDLVWMLCVILKDDMDGTVEIITVSDSHMDSGVFFSLQEGDKIRLAYSEATLDPDCGFVRNGDHLRAMKIYNDR